MNTDKIDKLIAEAKSTSKHEWGMGTREGYNACIITAHDGTSSVEDSAIAQIYGIFLHSSVEDVLGDPRCDNGVKNAEHIIRWQPLNVIALLEAFKAMREALALSGQLVEEATHEVCTCDSNQTQSCRYCSKLSKSDSVSCAAMDAADKVLEELP